MSGTTQTSVKSDRAIKREISSENSLVILGCLISLIARSKPRVCVVGCCVKIGDAPIWSQLLPGERQSRTGSRRFSPDQVEMTEVRKGMCCYHSSSEQSLIEFKSTTNDFQGDYK